MVYVTCVLWLSTKLPTCSYRCELKKKLHISYCKSCRVCSVYVEFSLVSGKSCQLVNKGWSDGIFENFHHGHHRGGPDRGGHYDRDINRACGVVVSQEGADENQQDHTGDARMGRQDKGGWQRR